jgi:hypothetical protein
MSNEARMIKKHYTKSLYILDKQRVAILKQRVRRAMANVAWVDFYYSVGKTRMARVLQTDAAIQCMVHENIKHNYFYILKPLMNIKDIIPGSYDTELK